MLIKPTLLLDKRFTNCILKLIKLITDHLTMSVEFRRNPSINTFDYTTERRYLTFEIFDLIP
ncbi:hypothetical protein BS618_31315 [Rhodococcus erythropolis]|nr:hypothetical protein AOT96_22190 [Rhodococcus sp. 008]OKA09153.1 hypothetical protein BS618_31315 [Rhodococcus erythropolis]